MRQRVPVIVAAQVVPLLLAAALAWRGVTFHPSLFQYLLALWLIQGVALAAAARFIVREEVFRGAAGAIVFFSGVPLNGLLIYAFNAR